jgi:hypothetical protein
VAAPIADADGTPGTFDPNVNGADLPIGGDNGLVVNGSKVTHGDTRKFAMSDDAPADISDFTGRIDTRTKEAKGDDPMVHDMVTSYTNQKAPTNKAYTKYFLDADDALSTVDGANKAVASIQDAAKGILVLDADLMGDGGLIKADAFPSGINQEFEFVADMPDTDTDETKAPGKGPRAFNGTFRGVPGEFECGTGMCTAETNEKGELKTLSAGWTFDPAGSLSDIIVAGVIPDADYLQFGYWVEATTEDDETTRKISTFFGGSTYTTDISTLIGSATYKGSATGLYVKKSFSAESNDFEVSNSGQFTAKAELTANFGGEEFGANSAFRIDGTINGFKDGEDYIDSNWTVTLNRAVINPDDWTFGAGATPNPLAPATATTGAGSTPGGWNGAFFGNPVDRKTGEAMTNLDSTPNLDDRAPTSVAGEFNAHFNPGGQAPGHVTGAFGATR